MVRFRICFSKQGELKFISHLDLQRTVQRALNRADLPVAYSQGYNPQPRLVFAAPLAVGIAGENEFFELDLTAPLEPARLREKLRAQLPRGLEIRSVRAVDPQEASLASQVTAALYRASLPVLHPGLQERIARLQESSALPLSRPGKKGLKKIDIRPFIIRVFLDKIEEEEGRQLFMLLATGHRGGARPGEILQLLGLLNGPEPAPELCRVKLLVSRGDGELLFLEAGS